MSIPEPPHGFDVDDPRVSFSRETNRWELEDEDGNTMEWDSAKGAWIPVVRTFDCAGSLAPTDFKPVVTPGR